MFAPSNLNFYEKEGIVVRVELKNRFYYHKRGVISDDKEEQHVSPSIKEVVGYIVGYNTSSGEYLNPKRMD